MRCSTRHKPTIGAAAELAAQLARHAAALHGARLEIASRAGTRITMTFDS